MVFRFAIIGTGKIAAKHAHAMHLSSLVEPAAVVSRDPARAEAFARAHDIRIASGALEDALNDPAIDAFYIAVPTAAKHALAAAVLEAGKHVIIEKPLANAASARELGELARKRGLLLMDATHFSHNPRTDRLRYMIREGMIGSPLTLVARFHANVGGPENIRFDPALEPYGALGDLGWYCARLVTELIPCTGATSSAHGSATWRNRALTSVSAVCTFPDSDFRLVMDCGFDSRAFVQEMTLVCTEGIISMDDFVHDWERARIGQEKPQFPSGFRLRRGRADPDTEEFIQTPAERSHMIQMLENFAASASGREDDDLCSAPALSEATQGILDDIWESLPKPAT